MASRFTKIYYIRNNAATYEAWQDNEAAATYTGSSLVTDVLNAIETANSSGNFMLLFDVGTFDMGTENWTLNTVSNVTLAGAGVDMTTIQNSTNAANDSEPFSFTTVDHITIRDMTVSAGGTARSTSDALDFDAGDDCLVERVRVILSRGDGIVFDGKDGTLSQRNTVRDCEVTGADLSGIQLLAADDNIVTGNRIHGNGESGIKLNRDTSPAQDSSRNIIEANSIYENDEAGIEILECSRNIVRGNQIWNNGKGAGTYDDGIVIDDFATAGIGADDNIITGNQIFDTLGTPTQDRAININDAAVTGTIITGNIIGPHVTSDEAVINDLAADTIIKGNHGYPDKAALEVSAAHTLTITDPGVLAVDTSGGTVAVTLPDNAAATGRSYIVRRDGASNATVTRAGADTFDDAATVKTLGSDGAAIGIVSIGDTEWKIVSTEGTVT